MAEIKPMIHKYCQNGTYMLLDVNSGIINVIDKMTYDVLDVYDGTNKEAVYQAFALYIASAIRGDFVAILVENSLNDILLPSASVTSKSFALAIAVTYCLLKSVRLKKLTLSLASS